MIILIYAGAALIAYFFVVFILLRLIVPFMGFRDFDMPQKLPQEIQSEIKDLEARAKTKKEYLELVYGFVTSRWHAGRIETLSHAPLAFRTDLIKIWHPGYGHCNTQNHITGVLLAGSKWFDSKDIKLKHVFFNFFIHQYLQIKLEGGEWMDVDPAGASIRGMPLGAHIQFFG